jgi:hypothetical protein
MRKINADLMFYRASAPGTLPFLAESIAFDRRPILKGESDQCNSAGVGLDPRMPFP